MRLNAKASNSVITSLADELGIDKLEAAAGILTILNSNMANAIRSRTVQKGLDPRKFSLVAMGGAGPLHGAEVAAMLQIPEVIVPPFPGITSALGLLTADLRYDAIRTQFQVSTTLDLNRIVSDFKAMEKELTDRFSSDGIKLSQVTFNRSGDLRYVGQGYELKVPISDGRVDANEMSAVWEKFHNIHSAEYGHAFESSPIEVVNLRVTAFGNLPKLEKMPPRKGGSLEDALLYQRNSIFNDQGVLKTFETRVYRRALMPIGMNFKGPAILLQKDSTTVVPPRSEACVHISGSIIIKMEG